ncbi:MAG: hypothetical protein ABNH42_04240 [Marinobacter sp.]|jgi:hypothetical protein
MSEVNSGGPAFPVPNDANVNDQEGMTLRDYFAAKCDVSFYAPSETLERQMGRNPTIGEMADYIASIRYIEADAMLAQRDTDTTER